ncbi:MAG TPA: TonB family protein [Burkholderiales bacterium]|nr:TonB family protein [Burkholderiales bacterium]
MIASTSNPARERPLAAAIAISIAIHAIALALFPQLRPLRNVQEQPLTVEFLPQVPEPAPTPVPVSEPVARPAPPLERPRPKVTKPTPAVTAREAPPVTAPVAPQQELLTAAPEAPAQPSQFSVPAAPHAEPAAAPVKEAADSAAADPDMLASYGHALSQAIAKHQRYPRLAQMRGWQGTATVALKFGAGNRLLATTLYKSSGQEVLDEQALQMVKDAQPLPSAPERLRSRDFTVHVPIVFRLRE